MRFLTRVPLFVLLALASCVIIPPDEPPPPVEVPVPVEVPKPVDRPDGPKGTYLLFMIRIDRGTLALAGAYEKFVTQMSASLATQGFQIKTAAVASLYDQKILWADSPDLRAPVSLKDALVYYSKRAIPPLARPCTTTPLAVMTSNIALHQVFYPFDLLNPDLEPGSDGGIDDGGIHALPGVTDAGAPEGDGGTDSDGGVVTPSPPYSPFPLAPGAFLTVLIDSAARPFPHDSPSCVLTGGAPAEHFRATDQVKWLFFPDAFLNVAQTRFVLAFTPEKKSFDEMARACLKVEGFPRSGIDAIEPSPEDFFGTFGEGLNEQMELSASADFCSTLGGDWTGDEFAASWAKALLEWRLKGTEPRGLE
jgi:hypothetical protein